MSTMKIGWAETNITPEKKVSLAGQFAERISEYVEKPLTCTALAIECGGDQVVFAACELVNVSVKLGERIRAAIAEQAAACGLDVSKVIISATHTHTGPVYAERGTTAAGKAPASVGSKGLLTAMLPPGKKYVEKQNVSSNPEIATKEEVSALLTEKIGEAILKAWNAREEGGSFTNAFARAAVGMCRRACYNDGSAAMWGETNTAVFTQVEGGSDTGVELLYVFNKEKKLTGVVANIACPAQCVQHRLFVSPDYWGEAKKLIREHFGEDLFLLPLCAPAGDQCPVDIVRWVEPESDVFDPNIERVNPVKRKADPSMFDLAGMRKAGKRVAHEIIETFEEGLDEAQEDIEFVHHVKNVKLPLRRTTRADLHKAEERIRTYLERKQGDVDYNDAAHLQVDLGTVRRFYLQETCDILNVEVHTLRIGSVAFATNPFELFLDYGNQIRARSNAEQTFLIQLACGAEGYLPTEKAEQGGHYSAFVASGQVGHVGGEQLVRETLEDINTSLFPY
ncbi:MAG: hypothetical protein IKY02_01195 [Lachnospiraceae bacterium]|nr:hypothetical protein [Lachnospiraceae bacterium]